MPLRSAAVSIALTSALALAACGGADRDGGEAAEQQATPAQARAEIGQVRKGLAAALASLREGDAKAADDAVAEAYVEHFEKVEGPLEKVDGDLKERLEDGIREDLRDKIKAGASVAEISGMVQTIEVDLATAERKLR